MNGTSELLGRTLFCPCMIVFMGTLERNGVKSTFNLKFPFGKAVLILRYQAVSVFTGVTLLTTLLLFGAGRVLFAALNLVLYTL